MSTRIQALGIATYTKKTVTETVTFPAHDASFNAIRDAEVWLKERGYSLGVLCYDEPIAVVKGDVQITKWHNIDHREWSRLDGVLVSDDFRDGDVIVVLYSEKE